MATVAAVRVVSAALAATLLGSATQLVYGHHTDGCTSPDDQALNATTTTSCPGPPPSVASEPNLAVDVIDDATAGGLLASVAYLVPVFGGMCLVGVFVACVLAAVAYVVFAVIPQLVIQTDTSASCASALSHLRAFYGALHYYIVRGGAYPAPYFEDNTQARCQVYSLALVYRMWSEPHYRNGDFHEDMTKNLRNVAIPGTGIPLSVMCYFKPVAVVFLLLGYPLAALVAALNKHRGSVAKVACAFSEQLLCPQDWFAFWQLNCRLATHHSSVTGETDYGMEDKLEFLECAERNGIAVTPWMKTKKLIVKHRNEEGGLGFHAFDNCTSGGNWIIQEALDNDEFVSGLLPDEAPLSTFRVVSASRGGLSGVEKGTEGSVTALSCVFRAGREGAVTDHVSVLYDVDMQTGVIGEGTTNQHWYQLGLDKIFTCPWLNSSSTTVHPDTGRTVTGTKVPDMEGVIAFVEKAHARMMPGVPLAGWDVAMTNKGMLLLEANLSCNFFRGSFDKQAYFGFVEEYFLDLAAQQAQQAKA